MSFSSINADTIDNIVVRLQVGHITYITMEHRVIILIFFLCEYVKKSDHLSLANGDIFLGQDAMSNFPASLSVLIDTQRLTILN